MRNKKMHPLKENYERLFKRKLTEIDDVDTFFDSVDFSPVEVAVSKLLGIKVSMNFKVESIRGNRSYLSGRTQNLIDNAGVFKPALKEVHVDVFNSSINAEEEKIWMTLSLSWKSKTGGTNGMKILTCWFNDPAGPSKWIIQDEERKSI